MEERGRPYDTLGDRVGTDATFGSFEAFLQGLRSLNWSAPRPAHQRVEHLLKRLDRDRRPLVEEVRAWQPGGDQRISRETSTHYKWFVHEDATQRFIIWLHEYKTASIRGNRHAVIPHNHRYWFSSLVLSGGFTSQSFVRGTDGGRLVWGADLNVAAGEVFTIPPDQIHALTRLEDDTMTLIVQGRPVREYSEAYDAPTGEAQRFYDLDARLPWLQSRIT